MKHKFNFSDGSYLLVNIDSAVDLPLSVYSCDFDFYRSIYKLVPTSNLENIPEEILGDLPFTKNRIIKSFLNQQHPSSMGVLLSGIKGSGKTLLAKLLANQLMYDHNMPVVIVSNIPIHTDFVRFVSSLPCPCVFLFDEYEKMIDYRSQDAMLSLFDGVYDCNHVFVVTCNDVEKVSPQLLSRPGRMLYHIKFDGLNRSIITDYLTRHLNNKSHTASVLAICDNTLMTMDILKALIHDMNIHSCDAHESVKFLNVCLNDSTDKESCGCPKDIFDREYELEPCDPIPLKRSTV